jgi:Fur family peroxide stress response transcriptional regulator
MDTVHNELRAKDMRVSHQRVKILEFLRTRTDHPSARQVYESLLQEMPSLSRTTIYNSLNALAEKGIVGVVRASGGETRYEYADRNHCHFVCTTCHRVIDTEFVCVHLHAVESQGHEVYSVQGCFYGVCKECVSTRQPEDLNV